MDTGPKTCHLRIELGPLPQYASWPSQAASRTRFHFQEHCGAARIVHSSSDTRQKGERSVIWSLEKYLPPPPGALIRKLTIPANECVKLYELCQQLGYNAARLYPSADGASMSVTEGQLFILGIIYDSNHWQCRNICLDMMLKLPTWLKRSLRLEPVL